MNLDNHPHSIGPAREASAPRAGLLAWIKLLIGAALVVLFLAASHLVGQHVPLLKAWAKRVDAYDLRPSAIYYTDYEASGDAESLIRSSLEYAPSKDDPPRGP
ncbi:MAG: hypothetical protein C4519_15580 [Desulfobacteraceae bacterium]|nr:MAG: hypothetical protein C4519_15580 [Desulfobacteraceae bacterium]